MAFLVKNWQNGPGGGTRLNRDALRDTETRLSDYTDEQIAAEAAARAAAIAAIDTTPPDGSITPAKLSFDPAIQAELDAVAAAKQDAATAATDAELAAEAAARVAGDQGVGAPNTQAASYQLVAADAGKSVEMSAAGATTLTVPANATVPFAIGTVIEVARTGVGAVTIHPAAGVVLRNRVDTAGAADRTIANQYSSVSLRKRATDEWVLVGDLA